MKNLVLSSLVRSTTRVDNGIAAASSGALVWLAGLSGIRKSTLAQALAAWLQPIGRRNCILDGDVLRRGLCANLSYVAVDQRENIRRAGEVACILANTGLVVITAFISPFHVDRARVRDTMPAGRFVEVYCRCTLAVCEVRDVKGLYGRARGGEVADFTGISSPDERPASADLVLNTSLIAIDAAIDAMLNVLARRAIIGVPA